MTLLKMKVRDLLFAVLGTLVITGTTANGLLLLTVWGQYQEEGSQEDLYKLFGSLGLAGISTIVVILTILILVKHLSHPLNELTDKMIRLSHKELNIHIPYQEQKNEFGDMSRALALFRNNMAENERLHAEQIEEDKRKLAKAQSLEESIARFDEHVNTFMSGMRASMDDLIQTSHGLGHVARTGVDAAKDLQTKSGEASNNTNMVYESAQGMLASIAEVTRHIEESEKISCIATNKANEASQSIAELQQAADRINGVITLINDIAKQTNMLALNATIESERAGAAGKGFAVVAGEVKKLASQTSEATEEISAQVESVKRSVSQTVTRMDEIGAVIAQMHETLVVVSSSMVEQDRTSQDIASNAQNAVSVSQNVSKTSNSIYDGSQQTEESAQMLNEVSDDLLRKTASLTEELQKFFQSIKK